MTFIPWDNNLDLHVDTLDDEHKTLIGLMNRLYEQNMHGVSCIDLEKTLMELATFTEEHFVHEENYMESIGYDELNTHRLIHQRLLKRLQGFIAEFREGNGTVSREFLDFLKIWVAAHIKGIDMKFGTRAQ